MTHETGRAYDLTLPSRTSAPGGLETIGRKKARTGTRSARKEVNRAVETIIETRRHAA